jgi:hypothetical protein
VDIGCKGTSCLCVLSLCRVNSGSSRPRGWTEEQEMELRNLFDQCRSADGKLSATDLRFF